MNRPADKLGPQAGLPPTSGHESASASAKVVRADGKILITYPDGMQRWATPEEYELFLMTPSEEAFAESLRRFPTPASFWEEEGY